jgi:hypothetical protein
MASDFTGIITNEPYIPSWSHLNIDQTYSEYSDRSGTNNSLRVNAVMVYYCDKKTTYNNKTVKIAYIFWMGVSGLGACIIRWLGWLTYRCRRFMRSHHP